MFFSAFPSRDPSDETRDLFGEDVRPRRKDVKFRLFFSSSVASTSEHYTQSDFYGSSLAHNALTSGATGSPLYAQSATRRGARRAVRILLAKSISWGVKEATSTQTYRCPLTKLRGWTDCHFSSPPLSSLYGDVFVVIKHAHAHITC